MPICKMTYHCKACEERNEIAVDPRLETIQTVCPYCGAELSITYTVFAEWDNQHILSKKEIPQCGESYKPEENNG